MQTRYVLMKYAYKKCDTAPAKHTNKESDKYIEYHRCEWFVCCLPHWHCYYGFERAADRNTTRHWMRVSFASVRVDVDEVLFYSVCTNCSFNLNRTYEKIEKYLFTCSVQLRPFLLSLKLHAWNTIRMYRMLNWSWYFFVGIM